MRRHRGTVVMACCVKRRDSKKMGVLLAAAGIFVPDMTRLNEGIVSTVWHVGRRQDCCHRRPEHV
jgi:hypothetical protein